MADGMPLERKRVSRVLLSVSDKTGLVELGKALAEAGVEVVATSSTAQVLRDANVEVTEVSALTGFPEILGGRVKTLHPNIHGAILARQDNPADVEQLTELGVTPIDAVVVNFYPFSAALASGASQAECVEMIDIGGPTLVRAAAKNAAHVAVLTSPTHYKDFIAALNAGGTTSQARQAWAKEAFLAVANYDLDIANWFSSTDTDEGGFPQWVGASYDLVTPLRYGENPHQKAAVYKQSGAAPAENAVPQASENGGGHLATAKQLHGKELSYNNLQDTDAALKSVQAYTRPTITIIKHANPAGIASGSTLSDAYRKALLCDPLSAFGGVVASNETIDADVAEQVAAVFTEVVAAPGFTEEALAILTKKKAIRLLEVNPRRTAYEFRQIDGGLLLQESDRNSDADLPEAWTLVAGKRASRTELRNLTFAWQAVQFVKSNAILLAQNEATVGVGMGQVNRVDAARLAVQRANTLADGQLRSHGAVAASDAFFPFPDGLQILIDAGVTAVVAPGGSKRDEEVRAAAEAAGLTLYFTSLRHFWH